MTRSTTSSRLTRLTAILAAGVALTVASQGAYAMGSHGPQNQIRNTIHPIVTGDHRKTETVQNCKNHKCATSMPTTSGNQAKPNQPTNVTVSNGVRNSTLPQGAVTVSSSRPGTITISNGTQSVTLPGGSVTLGGGITSVSAGSGFQTVRTPNGYTVAANPSSSSSAGGTITRDHRGPDERIIRDHRNETSGGATTAAANPTAAQQSPVAKKGESTTRQIADTAVSVGHEAKAAGRYVGREAEKAGSAVVHDIKKFGDYLGSFF
ncbi:MAG TPA: hypothetical protein VHN11_11585 [Xanthobacteraceae bacterium]|jgi:hypothetical protein|nr:hypothetical protein [Xanthobacteraceae bacterium]